MGGIVSQPNYSVEQLKHRYELRNMSQAKALQRYLDAFEIKYKFVDKIYQRLTDNPESDINSDTISKNEFLNVCDLYPTPFALGALNVLDISPKCEFFEFFAAVHHYNTMCREELIAHTFNLADEDGGGTVSMEELTHLVHHVYGEKVSRSEAGLHVTNNVTDIATAKIVMGNIDPKNTGEITLHQFTVGMRKHANLLTPAFNTQLHLRRKTGGNSVWKHEQERMTKFCAKHQLRVKDVYDDIIKSLKLGTPTKTTGQGGLASIGTHDMNGNKRRGSTEEDDILGGGVGGTKWKTTKSAVKGTSAFAHRETKAPKALSKSSSAGSESSMTADNIPTISLSSFDTGSKGKQLTPVNNKLPGKRSSTSSPSSSSSTLQSNGTGRRGSNSASSGSLGVTLNKRGSVTESNGGGGGMGGRRGSMPSMGNSGGSMGGRKGSMPSMGGNGAGRGVGAARRKSVKSGDKLNSVIIPNSPVRFVPKKDNKPRTYAAGPPSKTIGKKKR